MYRKVRELRGSLQSAPVLVADIGVLRVRGGPTKATASVILFDAYVFGGFWQVWGAFSSFLFPFNRTCQMT